jgi:hypothetical protein
MAAYIDLNPVRAGLCEDPKDYRWSGYGEAVAGGALAREAVRWLAQLDTQGPRAGGELVGARGEAAGLAPGKAGGQEVPGPRDAGRQVGSDRRKEASAGYRTQPAGCRRAPWEGEALRVWRCELFGIPADERGQAEERAKGEQALVWRRRISRQKALEVLAKGGRLPAADYLRCRVRYFTDGAAIGTKDFVERVFAGCREWFSEGRKTGARCLRGLELQPKPERLYSLRALRRDATG